MLPYRIVRWLNEVYPPMVFFLYIGLALTTFAVCFLLPFVAVLALVFSIFALVPAVVLWRLLQASERALARGFLKGRRCPCCGSELPLVQLERVVADGTEAVGLPAEAAVRPGSDCLACGASFEINGTRVAT